VIETLDTSDRNDALLGWYTTEARELPWRVFGDPYLTLVSEVMLQQTQVERVIPKFTAFVDTWATVGELAGASSNDLLSVWSGLGYNSRAFRLRESARIVADRGWPTSVAGLEELPGIGPYTAAAIASIAFGVDVPAIDTNLKRVLSRWHGEPLSGTLLDEFAVGSLAPPAGLWNQAVMDLGATMCRPTSPACGDCPVSRWCADPTVYEPPVKQSRFKGSRRELRGALVRASLSNGDLYATGEALGCSDTEISETITVLRTEGLVD
jgi:A/G-specific adenine glycosylase